MKKFSQGNVISLGVLSTVLLVLISCSSKKDDKNMNELALPVFEVDTTTVILDNDFLGTVEGKYDVEIRPQVEGVLQQAYVDEGDHVEKGDKLFKIDPSQYQEDLNSALAEENVEQANLINAQTEVDRLRPLVENEVMAPVRLQKEQSNYKVAEANLKQASAAVSNAKIILGYTTITAPVSGYIGRIKKRLGNLVKPSDDEPITVLTGVQEIYVYFSVNESDFSKLRKTDPTVRDTVSKEKRKEIGQRVSLILPDGTEYSEDGFIDATSGQVNRKTGTVTIRATFPNENAVLRSGNTVTLVRHDLKKGRILIPQKATFELQAKKFVIKLTPEGYTVRQLIEIESEAPNNQYIVSSGLRKGDRILVGGMEKVSDSTKIKPLPYLPDTLVAPTNNSLKLIDSMNHQD
ncbi:RND family efflux transporter MFP subunit [Galbibacter marinus]|uniref:RND family efflux transporter MFP subunit n=1 Tax=Galbibacter marinus TaxID=555500 RepID=K2QHS6_9FLAO|nr:efflux RND transporter periplasmic adaptor subunit [Galbibacter marinus]EKF54262.1 RND family efflux transporter MFP subunit [Galbibacter marinus]